MRVRKIKDIDQKISKVGNKNFLEDFSEIAGKWKDEFNSLNPIYIEVGIGKGKFITEMSKKNKDINFIGIEKVKEIVYKSLKKDNQNENLRILLFDGGEIDDIFTYGEVSRIYLNFSDPWPKNKNAKRRLTHPIFLKKYLNILKDDGELIFKTDNIDLFEFSLCEFSKNSFYFEDISLNYKSEENEDDIMTEYEEKFRSKDQVIYRVIAKKRFI